MSRWTAEEDETLRQLAADGMSALLIARALEGRSESAVSGRLSRLGVPLKSRAHQALIEYLTEGGRLARERIGGVVGDHWTRATRTGGHFSAALCERLLSLGFIRPEADRENVFRWSA